MSRAAIIVASGSSRRMGFDKLAALIDGNPVLWHSVRAFSSSSSITQVVVVTPPERFEWLSDLGEKLHRVDGGKERSDSVNAGLAALNPDITHVAIHDGARPLVSPQSITATFEAAQKTGAAALARRVTETLKRSSPEGITTESVSRENLWIMETPQIFSRALIKQAYQQVASGDAQITDEVSALQLLGQGTTLVESAQPNPKITVQADLDALR
ncbi:2-C-methyl-D-erythritol 4-phosphate cytidylyltransferase [bacterium]|nr:2-C-methyl-D-erythritol 4-phosphate cytidylyltransferase [Verrucomicrobiaceae bacterium]MDA7615518.1 2-C-methyl-D-erythritol 4-phosphate cytidylyltransferase [Akkermansiaceae bacterium]MDA8964757.1 2-C-methyl-D-erythritol 4-phosphate cytidylyltransferase [bacterium]MDB2430249.1 2-C-methyl-D-erythritol 4-phosphate cytidylyltransferase [Akkermansiaceae bacterium]MDB4624303.1 2-C-methyl-D-erythritol 4-phosphate cytidylyltransferase [Akkermansiaceae bacterium]